MIRHMVLTRFAPGTDAATIASIYAGLSALVDRLPGARGFVGGASHSPEQIERGYKHGFTIDFDSWDALQTYAEHPEHKVLGAQLVAHAEGGVDGLIVLDIEV
ncbi:Dabb family protein [uncultured Tateyamaria sp.]|uniref:Dabb family protein n=1 Tax=uncultured Tateyamaria sp. TaxID=455651 RepID=UPI002607A279|nr:Dabb family protein [uncultured Tateyamaria sp.]